jgi:asparagine synthase (glutamine-hydrolysing)
MRQGEMIGRLYRAAPEGSPGGQLASQAVDRASGRTCLLVGRLHYKEDLLRVHRSLAGLTFPSDAALALAVFGAGGPQGLARLEGEFSLAVGDPAAGCLFVRRDPLGSWPLYWTNAGGRLLAGTGLLDLARRLGSSRVNLDNLGDFLMWPFAGSELLREDTILEPFRRAAAGQLLRLDSTGGAATVHEHAWPRPAQASDLDADAAGEQFLRLFREAVGQRLQPGSTGAHLSGGMDSSAVVCVARDLLRAQQAAAPLHTFSWVYTLPALAGETPYVHMVLDQGGPVVGHLLDGDQMLDFDWFCPALPEHDEPFAFVNQIASQARSVRAAQEVGATTVLVGEGAEAAAEGLGYYLADLIRQGRWITALRDVRRRARIAGVSPWVVLRQCGLGPLVPGRLRDGVGTLCRRGRVSGSKVGRSAIPPWIRPGFAREHRLWEKGREAVGRYFRPPYEESASRFSADGLRGAWHNWHLAGPRGMHISRPFLDPRLLAFSLSLPHRLRFQPGIAKPLLQSAMKGILPEPIRTRRWKRDFNAPYRMGLARRRAELERMVEHSAIADLDVIDRPALRTVLQQVATGLGEATAGFRMNSTLALIAWYDQLSPALARPADEPSEVVRGPATRGIKGCRHVYCH